MNQALRVLRPFLGGLGNWRPVIIKSTYIDKLSIDLVDTGIEVTAFWKGKSWKKVFTNGELLGHTATLPAEAWRVPREPCYWARQIIAAILNQRGVT
jgi:hypothetical protein